jgi:hypothetical protein
MDSRRLRDSETDACHDHPLEPCFVGFPPAEEGFPIGKNALREGMARGYVDAIPD